jgi:hypothetical protein
MALYNRHMAAIRGGPEWARVLRLYEYMQPDRDLADDEWRIVQGMPFHFNASMDDRAALIQEALQVAKTWGITSVTVQPCDVSCLFSPAEKIGTLREGLPAGFRDVRIRAHGALNYAAELLRSAWKYRISKGALYHE